MELLSGHDVATNPEKAAVQGGSSTTWWSTALHHVHVPRLTIIDVIRGYASEGKVFDKAVGDLSAGVVVAGACGACLPDMPMAAAADNRSAPCWPLLRRRPRYLAPLPLPFSLAQSC